MERQTRFNIWYVAIAILGVPWLRELWGHLDAGRAYPVQRIRAAAQGAEDLFWRAQPIGDREGQLVLQKSDAGQAINARECDLIEAVGLGAIL